MIRTIHPKHRVKSSAGKKCNTCGKIIFPGEYCTTATYAQDNEIYNWNTCDRCLPYVEEASTHPDYDWEDGMSEQDFRNYMYEEHPEVAKSWWEL